ncbi:MAG: AMP-binding protein [Microscillaceae bacterium]|nr:AMP-binding protein [Microscillaceae bacterium]
MTNQVAQSQRKASSTDFKLKPLIEYFYEWEKKIPNQVYLRQPYGDTWKEYTWKEVGDQARRIVSALKAMNLPEKSNIGLVSKNCAHWIMCDLAIMMSGHVSVPFYPTLDAEKLGEVLLHSDAEVLFIGKLDNWEGMKEGIPGNIRCITFPESPAEQEAYLKWDDLIAQHEPFQGEYLPDLDNLFTIIYTSGTTGMPKGVMHTFLNYANVLKSSVPLGKFDSPQNRFFSYLPLCHVAERNFVLAGSLYSGGSVSFVESLDTFAKNLADVQPTHFFAVPRIWTKFQLGVLSKMSQKKLDSYLKIPIFSSLVKKKIQKKLGLASARVMITAAAPMPASLISWYQKIGLYLLEAYGMTENAGLCTAMPEGNIKNGTVGQAYPNCDIKIDPKSGEILMKADWLMTGYYKEPQKTAETIKNGWLHTGDMGELDAQGFLKITGRVKDQFKGSKGEFIVPGPIEAGYATNNFVEQICIVGRGLPQPVALVVLSDMGMKLAQNDRIALIESLEATRKAVNHTVLSHEKVEKVIITKDAWTIENNMLTPTLKVKRNVLEDVYGERLNTWFEQKESIIWE